jgi:ParB family transcriptional regulator, chromosome partitioning protein
LAVAKRALGKGLDALIQTESQKNDDQLAASELPIDEIDPNNDQPRKRFNDGALDELADSIREKGIIQPIIVEKKGERYRIIAGERRFRAAKIAGLEKVPVVVRHYESEEMFQISLIENIQRENLNPIEEASAYETIMKQTGLSQEALASQVGKSRSALANSLRLLKLNKRFKDALEDARITPGHARALLSVVNPSDQDYLFSKVVEDGLSVREAEDFADRLNLGGNTPKVKAKEEKKRSPDIISVEQKLIESLGTKVQLKGSLVKGRIEISYYSKNDLERLYDLLAEDEKA